LPPSLPSARVTRSLDAIVTREPTTSLVGKEDTMSPASKAPAAKKVPASRPPAAKKAAPAKKNVPAKAAQATKKIATTKNAQPTKKAVSTKDAVSTTKKAVPKTAPGAKKPASTAKAGGAMTKEATITKKSGATAKKAVGPAKKATAAKAAAGAAKDTEEVAPVAPVAPRTTFTPKPKPPAPVKPKTGPYAKDDKFLEEITELLREERAIYQEQATSLRAEADSLALEREPGDVQFDEESGEGGTVTVDRERNLALSGQAALAVEEIDYASERVADKTYGYCERCFQPIPKPRLRALPYARLCVACKSGGLSRR
jgi:RNA polymerase-binding transcription factor DksA